MQGLAVHQSKGCSLFICNMHNFRIASLWCLYSLILLLACFICIITVNRNCEGELLVFIALVTSYRFLYDKIMDIIIRCTIAVNIDNLQIISLILLSVFYYLNCLYLITTCSINYIYINVSRSYVIGDSIICLLYTSDAADEL